MVFFTELLVTWLQSNKSAFAKFPFRPKREACCQITEKARDTEVLQPLIFCSKLLTSEILKCVHSDLGHLLKVLWRRGVILSLCSQNSQAEWVQYPAGPHHLSLMTVGCGLDLVCSICAIPTLGAKNATSP